VRSRTAVLGALVLAAIAYSTTQTMLVPALPGIERDLGTTAVGATALVSVFFVSGAVTTGVFGRLGDMFGKRRLLLVELGLFSFGAVLCALAPSLELLLAGRIVMGTGLAIFPLSFAIVRDTFPRERVPGAVVVLAATGGTGAALGQALGGPVSDGLGYHWVFWSGVIMGAAAILAVVLFVPESAQRTRGRVDIGGALLLGVALGAPLFAISQTPAWGWGGTPTLALIGAGLAVGVVFVLYERRRPEPLLDLETLLHRRVALTNVVTMLTGFSMFGAAVIFTQFYQEPKSTGYGFGLTATQAGLFLVPGYLMIMAASPLSARLSSRAGPKVTLVAGCGTAFAALVLMAAAHHSHVEMIVWPTLLYAGIGFVFGATPNLIMESVPATHTAQSTGFNLVLRNVGTSLGTQIAATFIVASIGASGLPREIGYTRAFAFQAFCAGLAWLIATTIPRRSGPGELQALCHTGGRVRGSRGQAA
jgi:MFS family permease